MNDLKHNVDGSGNITPETKTASTKNECESITQKWEKQCPKCHRIQTYSNKYKLERALHNNSKCSDCGQAHRKIVEDSEVYYRACPCCGTPVPYSGKSAFYTARRKKSKCAKCRHLGIKMPESAKRKLSIARTRKPGHPHTKSHRERFTGNGNPMYGVHRYDKSNPFFGKQHREEARRKMRVAACKRVLNLQRSSNGRVNNVGAGEKSYFDQLEKERGWFGNRQHFVSHLGYFVDYYEPKHNIVVEYDEPRHYRHGHLREKDRQRMEQIRAHLKCEFWRYDAYRKQLVEF